MFSASPAQLMTSGPVQQDKCMALLRTTASYISHPIYSMGVARKEETSTTGG